MRRMLPLAVLFASAVVSLTHRAPHPLLRVIPVALLTGGLLLCSVAGAPAHATPAGSSRSQASRQQSTIFAIATSIHGSASCRTSSG